MKKILSQLYVLLIIAFFMNGQVFAKDTTCRFDSTGVKCSAKAMEGHRPRAYSVVMSGDIVYYHQGKIYGTPEKFSKTISVVEERESAAIAFGHAHAAQYAQEKHEKQCEKLKCKNNN